MKEPEKHSASDLRRLDNVELVLQPHGVARAIGLYGCLKFLRLLAWRREQRERAAGQAARSRLGTGAVLSVSNGCTGRGAGQENDEANNYNAPVGEGGAN